MGRKLTTEEAIKKCVEQHGNKYDYSKLNYVNANTKVKIICPVHGEFEQRPDAHWGGMNCPSCARVNKGILKSINYKMTIVDKFINVHNDLYDYSNTLQSFVNATTPVTIGCNKHGNFELTPNKHLIGMGCPLCSKTLIDINQKIDDCIEKHNNKYDYSKVRYMNAKTKVDIICPVHGEFSQILNMHLKGHGCQKCAMSGYQISKQEQDYYDFLVELLGEENVKQSDRTILNGKELDIYLPNHNLAIEYNGLYWHSSGKKEDDPKMRQYHLNKTKRCAEKDIELLHINEGDNVELWKQVINNKLGLNKRIYARQTKIKEIDNNTCKKFLEENHLQGNCHSSVKLGIYQKGELYSVMTFGKARYSDADWELIRFCTKAGYTVVGGASKLLKMFKSTWKGVIISYANLRWSNGNLYNKLGFTLLHDSAPCYWYMRDGKLNHRSKFMKHKLEKQLEIYDNKLSEVDNMYNNKFRRIWDCGNKVYILRDDNEKN